MKAPKLLPLKKARSILDQSRSTIDLRHTIRNRHSGPEPESITLCLWKVGLLGVSGFPPARERRYG